MKKLEGEASSFSNPKAVIKSVKLLVNIFPTVWLGLMCLDALSATNRRYLTFRILPHTLV